MMGSNDLVDCQPSEQTTWQKIECAIRYNLAQFENGRKFCAYCGKKEEAQAIEHRIILGRCYGCQMVYYCSQEHQNADWLEHHMPKCAELEWVALGELIQSIPANPALTNVGMFWPENYTPHTWTDWFEIRPDLVQIAKQTAMILEQNQQVKFILNKFNRREPTNTDLVDGLLAAVTDSITYALSIGDCLIKTGINPNLKPVCIHLLHPPYELIDDLDYFFSCLEPAELYERLDKLEINLNIKKKFYELCNMFPLNKGIEIVFISSVSMFKQNEFSFDWSKVLKAPFMKTQLHKSLPLTDKNLYISAWQGSYSNYIKYACQIEGYSHPDLVVSFHPGFTSSPHKLINDWTDDLKIILTNNFPCLFTFYDKEEKQKAFNILSAFQSHFLYAQSNQFSSLLLKQMQAKPNHVYASNSFLIVIKGFVSVETDSRYNQAINYGILNEKSLASTDIPIPVVIDSKDNPKPNKNIHDFFSFHIQHQQQQQIIKMKQNCNNDFNTLINPLKSDHGIYQSNDACMQTLGLDEPENSSLRHINGKIQINKSSNYLLHNNNQETRIKTNENPDKYLPVLDFSSYTQGSSYFYEKQQSKLVNDQLDCGEDELKVNFRPSNFLNKSQFQSKKAYLHINNHCESNFYYQQKKQQQQNIQKDQFKMNNKLLMQSISQFKQEKISSTHVVYNKLLCRPLDPNFSENLTNKCIPVSLLREEPVSRPPPLKPRINICQTVNITPVIVDNPAILDLNDNINSIPSTKPRMRPTRIYEKYTSCLKSLEHHSPPIVAQDQPELNQPTNPLPKPRNSIHLISESKNDAKLNSQSYSSSECDIQNESDFNRINKMHEKHLIFKASVLKVKKKNQDFLQMSPSSSSSSSPSSSTSALSMFSPRSTEDRAQNHSSDSTSSSASSSQGVSSSSSISSFNSLSTKQNSGFVNQMKNIFESQQHENQTQNLDLKKNHQNINEKYLKQSRTLQHEILQKQQDKEEVECNNNIERVEPHSEYMNVSNKYLNFLKQQQSETNRSSPPNTPPPLPPSSPPISRSPSPAYQQEKQQSKSNINNDIISLISSPFKPTNDKLVTKIISNSNTQLSTLTTTTTTTTTFSSEINKNSKQLPNLSHRLISNLSSLNHAPLKLNNSTKSEFRILNNNPSITNNSDRSATTLSGKSLSSLSQSNNNLNLNNRIMLNHIPDSVDLVQFQYEGQRRVVVPGYMTSADILRNMLLNSNNIAESISPLDGGLDPSKAPIIIQRKTTTMSLKEKLLMQNKSENNTNGLNQNSFQPYQSQVSFLSQRVTQVPLPMYDKRNQHQQIPVIPESVKKQQVLDDDEKIERKFERSRTRSMSGIVTLDLTSTQNTQIIDIDLDYEASTSIENFHDRVEAPSHLIEAEPNSLNENYNIVPKQTINREIKPSIRINQLINTNGNNSTENGSIKSPGYSRRIPSNLHRQSVTGSFDPNDFDSFDEDDNNIYLANSSNCTEQTKFSSRPRAARQIESNPSSIQIESMEKIRESAILQQILEQEREKQQMNLVQFDPNDFDSFDEEENEQLNQNKKQNNEELPVIQLNFEQKDENNSRENRQLDFFNNRKRLEEMFRKNEYPALHKKEKTFELINIEEPIVINNLNKTEPISNDSKNAHYSVSKTKNMSNPSGGTSNFFRSAIDRISSRNRKTKSENKARSSSVPLRTLISSNLEIISTTEDSNSFLKQQQSKPPQPQQRSNLLKLSTSTKKPEAISQLPNMKTIQLMNKMQSEFDEKQKRRKLRREQKSKEEKLSSKSPKSSSSDRKFLSSIMNTIFSASYSNINDPMSSSNNETKPSLQKNDSKRVSLRKLKAKDKAKKKNESQSGDEQETMNGSNRSLNFIHTNLDQSREEIEQEFEKNDLINLQFMRSSSFDIGSLGKLTSIQLQPTSIGTSSISSRFGKIKNETDKPKNESNKENLMKQLKAELDEEIKDRRMLELKNNIINGTCNGSTTESTSSNSSNYSNRQSLKDSSQLGKKQEKDNNNHKIRSKSVTFLDEISTDDEVISMSNSTKIHTLGGSNSMPYSTPQLQQRHIIPNEENINFYTPISSRKPAKKNVKSGDVRMMCGALTGVGPIRSIMKKSATDLSLTLNTSSASKLSIEKHNNINQLSSIQPGEPYTEYDYFEEHKYLQTTINEAQPNIKKRDLMQSDL